MGAPENQALECRYRAVRGFTTELARDLSAEDCAIQTMPDVSPTRWHLAHTTWFFETFVLAERAGHTPFHPSFEYLFNSYYNGIGEPFPRPRRGLLSRPGLTEVLTYRAHVDDTIEEAIRAGLAPELEARVVLGLHHEQQHQELILTDIKHVFGENPLRPTYRSAKTPVAVVPREPASRAPRFVPFEGGLQSVGHEAVGRAGSDFHFDNERPRHETWLTPFELAETPVSCGEYLAFIEDGGYTRPELWLSLGWDAAQAQGWESPLYWFRQDGEPFELTLAGPRPLDPNAPVCHLSFFEADAFARWSGARLPSEAEWEVAARTAPIEGHFVDTLLAADRAIHPCAADASPPDACEPRLLQLYGDVWEWTSSPYVGYPGFRPAPGAIGEYNGKFMCGQYVLRGGSCATSRSHIRSTYRNFFPPEARWQFSGLRLARDLRD